LNLSWIMRELNEKVARLANAEDEVTGRFWEGRFKSQALLDRSALLSCMAYVDLNPVRAGAASTPEGSEFTSFKMRCNCFSQSGQDSETEADAESPNQPDTLLSFVGNQSRNNTGIEFRLVEYFKLVDWAGRHIREDKVGSIDKSLAPILERISITPGHWLSLCKHFENKFKGLVGKIESLKIASGKMGRMRLSNRTNSEIFFG